MNRHYYLSKGAQGKTWVVITLGLLGASWIGFVFLKIYLDHQQITLRVEELGDRMFMQGQHSIQKQIINVLNSYDISNVEEGDIKLELSPTKDKVIIEFPYRKIVDFLVVKRSYPYVVHVERYPKKPAGNLGKSIEQSIEKSNNKSDGRYNDAFQN